MFVCFVLTVLLYQINCNYSTVLYQLELLIILIIINDCFMFLAFCAQLYAVDVHKIIIMPRNYNI